MNLTELQQTKLLLHVARIVPAADRAEWSRFWQAELWCHRHATHVPATTDLHAGLVWDALWIRMERFRCVLRGTAVLYLVTLALACTLALLLATYSIGSWQGVTAHLALDYGLFLVATPLVLLVTFLTAPRRAVHANLTVKHLAPRHAALLRASFFTVKATLHFILAYLVGATLCAPLAVSFPNTAAFLQIPLYVVLSVLALRWSFEDQERRCKHCLRLLESPARVGRPSHNLLEWSGTALVCVRGHGVLSIPELETSWHQSSEWTQAIVDPFTSSTEQLA